jgi:hypothetical protein
LIFFLIMYFVIGNQLILVVNTHRIALNAYPLPGPKN